MEGPSERSAVSRAIILATTSTEAQRGSKTWDQWPSEPDEAYAAFEAHLRQRPPRRAARVVEYPTRQIFKWSTENLWVERSKDYDQNLRNIFLEEQEAIIRQNAREITAEH